MFKTNYDKMRNAIEATPERVLSVCRLLAHAGMTREEISDMMTIGVPNAHDQLRYTINVALEELFMIGVEDGKLVLTVDPAVLATPTAFRRYVSSKVFAQKDTTFHLFTKWLIRQNEDIFAMKTWDSMAKACGSDVPELADVGENDVLGWRFWAAFLGIGYLSGTMIIPNMKVRLEDLLATSFAEKFKYDEEILATDFLIWLGREMPEVDMGERLPLALSAGLRTLQDLGLIHMESWADSNRMMLYYVDGDPVNHFTHITVKEAIKG